MKKSALSLLFAATFLAGVSEAQAPQKQHSLNDAQAFFRKGDRDSDGRLKPAELTAMGITTRQASDFDNDGDTYISKREFYVAYRSMVLAGGEGVGSDLDAEVTRVLAERQAAEARKRAEQRMRDAKEAEDKADAKQRAKGEQRIQDAKDKADAEQRRKAQERIKEGKKDKRPVPRPRPNTPKRIGG
ncbi:MAG: hypothetical protein P1V81_03135 [Planctomycetota bacterium]|nr:hypothetical protein [Planctomycetota bacterium]